MDTIDRIHFLVDSNMGVYIPQQFEVLAKYFKRSNYKELEQELKFLENAEPYDSENYWETWEHILNTFYYHDEDGNKYYLHQSCDLFGVREGTYMDEFGD